MKRIAGIPSFFYTPRKSSGFVAMVVAITVLSPVLVALHFGICLYRGDYPGDADSIGIPIFAHWLVVFPVSVLLLVNGLKGYRERVFVFDWNKRHIWRSTIWTLVCVVPLGWWALVMIVEGIQARLYWISAFFLAQLYTILVLRAAVLEDGEAKQPCGD